MEEKELCKQIIAIQCVSWTKRGKNKVDLPRRENDQIQLGREEESLAEEETLGQVWAWGLKQYGQQGALQIIKYV